MVGWYGLCVSVVGCCCIIGVFYVCRWVVSSIWSWWVLCCGGLVFFWCFIWWICWICLMFCCLICLCWWVLSSWLCWEIKWIFCFRMFLVIGRGCGSDCGRIVFVLGFCWFLVIKGYSVLLRMSYRMGRIWICWIGFV